MRIWRKDSGDEVHLLAAFSPWRHGDTSTSEYRWQGDQPGAYRTQCLWQTAGTYSRPFRRAGDLSLCNGKWTGRSSSSSDQVALYRYRAEQTFFARPATPPPPGGSSCARDAGTLPRIPC